MDKKGLSTIVVTLIIILVSLVAVGIIWVVVRALINSGTQQLDISAKCLNLDIQATSVTCAGSPKVCDIVFVRTGTGTDVVGGVKLIFRNTTSGTSSPVVSVNGDIDRLTGKTATGVATNLTSVNQVEVTTFFDDASGNDKICAQTNAYTFA